MILVEDGAIIRHRWAGGDSVYVFHSNAQGLDNSDASPSSADGLYLMKTFGKSGNLGFL